MQMVLITLPLVVCQLRSTYKSIMLLFWCQGNTNVVVSWLFRYETEFIGNVFFFKIKIGYEILVDEDVVLRLSGLSTSTHYNDVTMGAMASEITSLNIVYSTVYSGADRRKHQRSASLAFVRAIHRWPVYSPHKWPVTRKMFPFDDVIMNTLIVIIWLSMF